MNITIVCITEYGCGHSEILYPESIKEAADMLAHLRTGNRHRNDSIHWDECEAEWDITLLIDGRPDFNACVDRHEDLRYVAEFTEIEALAKVAEEYQEDYALAIDQNRKFDENARLVRRRAEAEAKTAAAERANYERLKLKFEGSAP